ncbi:MAG: hypothetical protein ACK4UJ_00160 [Leptonema sp. (in: bacteria)]
MKNFFLILLIICFSTVSSEELIDWKISLKDSLENVKRERIDKNWSDIQIPIHFDEIVKTKNRVLWLRKEIKLEKNQNLSIYFSQVNGYMDVYFNEVKIASGPTIPGGSLLVSLPKNLYQEDYNLISIKFYLKSVVQNGIFEPVLLQETKNRINLFYKKNIKPLFISIVFGGVAFFLLFLFLKFSSQKYYVYLSLFYLSSSLSSFFSSPGFLESTFYPKIFYNLAMGLPIFLPVFYIRYFSLYFKHLSKTYWIHRFDLIISILLFFLIFLLGMYNIFLGRIFSFLWIVLFLLVLVYSLYIVLLELSKNFQIQNIILLLFLIYLITNSLNSLFHLYSFKEELFLYNLDVFLVLLIPVSFVFWEIIELQNQLTKKEEQFISFDILQTKLFNYILTALQIPIKELLEVFDKTKDKELTPNQAKNLIYKLDDLEKNLNDILELSRLEVLEGPESFIEINVKDFLETILNKSSISYSINVEPNLVLNTSLELVNSLLIRFVDFPGFGSFQHIDLVVLSEEDSLNFRFFLLNTKQKIINRIYKIIREKLPDQEGLWIQWKIIKEIIRVLGGNLKIKLYNKRYLYIEFHIRIAQKQSKLHKEKKEFSKKIPLVYLYYLENHNIHKSKQSQSILEKLKEFFKKKIA